MTTPILYAPCSPDLLDAAKKHARLREMSLAGLIRRAVADALGLPADFVTNPHERATTLGASKKKLARQAARR